MIDIERIFESNISFRRYQGKTLYTLTVNRVKNLVTINGWSRSNNYSTNLQLIDISVITKLLVDRGDILTLPRTSKTSILKLISDKVEVQ